MDPIACLLLAESQVFHDKDFAAACETLDNYDTWRRSGGFEPKHVTGEFITASRGDKFADKLENVIIALNAAE